MFMNDLNSAETGAVSPLRHDISGRFSRKGTVHSEQKNYNILDNILLILYIFFLVSTDFILFSGSGNVVIFKRSLLPIPEVSYILLGIFVVSAVFVFLVRNSLLMKGILAAFVSFAFIFIFYKQFSMLNRYLTIGDFNISMGIIAGIVIASICLVIFLYGEILAKVLLTLATAVLFFHIYFAYLKHSHHPEYIESYFHQEIKNPDNEKRFIYFMFPNLTSYANLARYTDKKAEETRDIIQGFYQKNKFVVYPKAFVSSDKYLENMVLSLNPEKKDAANLILNTRLLSSYWRFYNIRYEYINLKGNSLYDYFAKDGYQISAYKSRDFDMCHKQHAINVNRCIEKVNQPSNIYDANLSVSSRIKILVMEWLSSMKIFNDMSLLATILSDFVDINKIPMVGVNYSNLYVMNSPKIFNLLHEHIARDSGKQAYFVFIDLPSNMYIYDEFCQLKSTHEWMDIANLPWIKEDLSAKRREAYLQQTKCLYGELENFIERLQKDKKLNDTMIIIQGVSGTNDFTAEAKQDYIDNFIANKSVNMAVLTMGKRKSEINPVLCSVNDIVSAYLQNKPSCSQQTDIGIHDKIKTKLNSKLNRLTSNIGKDTSEIFTKWYEKWQAHNKAISMDNMLNTSVEAENPAEIPEKTPDKAEDAVKDKSEDCVTCESENSVENNMEGSAEDKVEDSVTNEEPGI